MQSQKKKKKERNVVSMVKSYLAPASNKVLYISSHGTTWTLDTRSMRPQHFQKKKKKK